MAFVVQNVRKEFDELEPFSSGASLELHKSLMTFWGEFYFHKTEICEVEKCLKERLSQCLKAVQLQTAR